MKRAVADAGLAPRELPEAVRLRRRGGVTFAFNYGNQPWNAPAGAEYLIGGPTVGPQDLAAWREA